MVPKLCPFAPWWAMETSQRSHRILAKSPPSYTIHRIVALMGSPISVPVGQKRLGCPKVSGGENWVGRNWSQLRQGGRCLTYLVVSWCNNFKGVLNSRETNQGAKEIIERAVKVGDVLTVCWQLTVQLNFIYDLGYFRLWFHGLHFSFIHTPRGWTWYGHTHAWDTHILPSAYISVYKHHWESHFFSGTHTYWNHAKEFPVENVIQAKSSVMIVAKCFYDPNACHDSPFFSFSLLLEIGKM